MNTNILDKNIMSSTHISFLFGAGVNGGALPQLQAFTDTLSEVEDLGGDISDGLEHGIDGIESEEDRERVKEVFIGEFKKFHDAALKPKAFRHSKSIRNLKSLIKKTYLLVNETQNRNPSMKQVNIYTLNYDIIVETVLSKFGYLYNAISASNNSTKAGLMDVIGFNYNVNKFIPTFMVSKLHGDIDKPIIPGKSKYTDILKEDYFEVVFNMKEQLCRPNSILIVIGYSGKDNHINKILEDCLNAGLTIYWYKYSEDDEIPFENRANVIIRDQDDYNDKQDTTLVCYKDMETAWAGK